MAPRRRALGMALAAAVLGVAALLPPRAGAFPPPLTASQRARLTPAGALAARAPTPFANLRRVLCVGAHPTWKLWLAA